MDEIKIGMNIDELPPHERKLILAYREQPDKQSEIDRILDLNNEYEAAQKIKPPKRRTKIH